MDKEKIKAFFKSKYNWTLIAILIFSFFLYFHYYDVNVNNSYWWDESTYLDGGKYWATGHPFWSVEPARPPLFMLLIAFFFKLGSSETIVRFFTVMLPSILTILSTYLLGKEMYKSKRVGLISAFMMSVCWVLLFNVSRVHTDALATFLGIMTFYFFWKGFIKQESASYKLLALTGLAVGLSFLVRLSSLLPLAVILLFVIILFLFSKDKSISFKNSMKLWIIPFIFILVLVPYAIWGYYQFENPLPWLPNYFGGTQETIKSAPAWNLLSFVSLYLEWPYFILFIIGLLFTYKLFIGFDIIIKEKQEKQLADLFNIINISVILFFFIFITRIAGAEHRWLLMMAPSLFFIASRGALKIYKLIKPYGKALAIIIVVGIILAGAYPHLQQNDGLIKDKITTESYTVDAGQFIQQNTKEDDIIMSANIHAELTYTSERQYLGVGTDDSNFLQVANEKKPPYLILSAYYPSPDWVYGLPQKYPQLLEPVQAYFADEAKTQPLLIIYKFNYEALK